jgi:hypothetical protein
MAVVTTSLDAAWRQLHAATPPGWVVGRPHFHDELDRWEQHAYDGSEVPHDGKRSREWTAVSPTEVEVVREMARCLRELGEGRWPR